MGFFSESAAFRFLDDVLAVLLAVVVVFWTVPGTARAADRVIAILANLEVEIILKGLVRDGRYEVGEKQG